MRIQHNIMAMNAYRNYNKNTSALSKNLEKLSSGYKINRAGDDAAGLAISEKMRAQITGLKQAQANAKSGINLVQTAEGALTEVHDMLNRMVKLADQSANGTYDDGVDRVQLQKELNQLRSEVDRIADATNFNGIKLLDGSLNGVGDTTTTEGDIQGVTVTHVLDGDHSGADATAGEYSFDLKDLKVYNTSSGAGAVTVVVTINSKTITLAAANVSAGAAATANELTLGNTSKTVTMQLDGSTTVTFNVSQEGSKIILKQSAVPANSKCILEDTANAMKLTWAFTDPTGAGKATHNQSYDGALHVDKYASELNPAKVAQGNFALTNAMVKDGAKLTIGKNTYVFQVGKDSKVTAGDGETAIDLKAFEENDTDLARQAVMALAKDGRTNNELFDITTDAKSATNLYLTEKVGSDGKGVVDYEKDWNLKGPTGNTLDADWNNKVGTADDAKDGKTGVVTWQAAPTKTEGEATGKSLRLQIGDTSDSYNQLNINIKDMHCEALGIDADSMNIDTQKGAADAVKLLKDAVNKVSDLRGTLGATQNRLDHTINNLSVMEENIQDAESTIRDTDIADEMMAYTKNNILVQSAQAMLAQANQVPQGVLQLLQ